MRPLIKLRRQFSPIWEETRCFGWWPVRSFESEAAIDLDIKFTKIHGYFPVEGNTLYIPFF